MQKEMLGFSMSCDPHWTSYISALLVPLVAIFGSYIAFRQWRTAQNKLKLELFERRLKIYNSATSFISSVMTTGKATDRELHDLIVDTKEAKWLLSKDIAKYLDEELYSKGVDLQCFAAELEGVPISQARTNTAHEQRDIKKWLYRQYGIVDEKFSKYLQLSH